MLLVYGAEGVLDVTSFQTYQSDSSSQSGFILMLNEGAVRWKSSKQDDQVYNRNRINRNFRCREGGCLDQ